MLTLLYPSSPKASRQDLGKAISVMAWIEDGSGNVLLVRQMNRKRLWTLPGGKVHPQEAIHLGLKRELVEEIGEGIKSAHIVDIFDRPEKNALCILFQTILKGGRLKLGKEEIEAALFTNRLPPDATPSLIYFWQRHFRRGQWGRKMNRLEARSDADAPISGLRATRR
ncbi:MAG TPA: NUDIX hydrolase [Candidatus Methylacidiphilales bacterium]